MSAKSRSAAPKRLGSETPRIFTPPLRPLNRDTSLGPHVVAFASKVLKVELFPWQKWLLLHMLELREDNSLRFRTVVVLVARQNGKSLLGQVLSLWFMYVYHTRLILGTAQDLDTAEEVWDGAVALVQEEDDEERPVRPELAALVKQVVRVNGKKSLVLKTGERYKVKAANRKAGRGLTGDVILLDELREHQSWDAWASITYTTMAREDALVLALSNAGDSSSVVLHYLRKQAHSALGDPDGICAADASSKAPDDPEELPEDVEDLDDDALGIFEWSAAPGCSVHDRDGWAQANPRMGYGGLTERNIALASKQPAWVFRPEALCQWVSHAAESVFPEHSWERTQDDAGTIAADSPTVWGLDVSWDRSTTHIGVAGYRPDALPQVELVASRVGTDWVVPWFTDPDRPERRLRPIAVQGTGAPASSLIKTLEGAGLEVLAVKGTDLAAGCGELYDRVRAAVEADEGDPAPRVFHLDQPLLAQSAAVALTRPLGDAAWVWDRAKSPVDIGPLVCVTLALRELLTMPVPKRSKYEDADLMVV